MGDEARPYNESDILFRVEWGQGKSKRAGESEREHQCPAFKVRELEED